MSRLNRPQESEGAASAPLTAGHGGSGSAANPALQRTIESELVPRLLLAHRASPFHGYEPGRLLREVERLTEEDRAGFLEAVLGPDDDRPAELTRMLVSRGVPVEIIYLELVAPVARILGDMWTNDECDFLDVTIGTGRLQRVLREQSVGALTFPGTRRDRGRVLLSCIPGEQHTLGLYMVGDLFLRDGWGVQVMTPDQDGDVAAFVREERFDVMGFSVASESRLLRLRSEIAAVRRASRNPHLIILIGGRVIAEHPELVTRVGADGCVPSGADAPRQAGELLARIAQ